MLFLVFGSSGSGKTTLLEAIRGHVERLALHDFDELGVPANATTAWRHEANERWLRRALDYQAEGTDMLLAGQTPLAEILAAPRRRGSTGWRRACSTATTRRGRSGWSGARSSGARSRTCWPGPRGCGRTPPTSRTGSTSSD